MIEFRILGPLEAADQRQPITLGGPKQRALLAALLLHRGEVVASDRLIDDLWGETPPATAAKTLQGYVSHLRRALPDDVLVTRNGGYELLAQGSQVDADRFVDLVAQGRRALAEGDASRARELFGGALALWRGEPLADLAYEPFAQAEIARLAELRVAAVEDRIEADLMLGRHRALVGELETLASRHPNRERLLGQLMLALYRGGRQADALDAYRRGRRRAIDELGLEPGPELRVLERRILEHDPSLLVPEAPPQQRSARHAHGPALIAAGGALLAAAAIAAAAVVLTGGGAVGVRVAPNSVAAIDTHTGRVVGEVSVGARPGAIAFGSGSLWVANRDDESVSRVDPHTLQTLRTIALSDPPTGIATVPGGVWVVTSGEPRTFVTVSRIDPRFDTLGRAVRIPNVYPGSPGAVAARRGAVWVAPFSGELTRLDARSGRVLSHVDPNAGPAQIALGGGAVWATDTEADNVTRIEPTGLTTSVAVGHRPTGVAAGAGAIWVADTGDDAVVRIDPDTRAVTTTIPVGRAPIGVTVGAGSVWVANSGAGTVSRIDPATNRVVKTIVVGASPQQIAVAGSRAWVTVDASAVPAAPAGDGTARVDALDDVDYMDPALAYFPNSRQLLYATCAQLLNYPDVPGPEASRLVPEVARSLPARSADGRTYTYVLRSGFRFSPPSSEPVTAQTFKATIERTLDHRMQSPVAGSFRDVVGARAYMAGRANHIAGVVARDDTLVIRLVAPVPDLPARLAEPFFCAVPPGTPVDPKGVRVIPSAGPYRVASYTPGQGIVLTRNPNYHGSRPHHLARIEVAVGIPPARAVADVESGAADYATDGEVDVADARRLAVRYGASSPAARRGRQRFFVAPAANLDFFALNTHRPLFADGRLRRAASYAIDRRALARVGSFDSSLPDLPTDHYLPPGTPGYSGSLHVYPLRPDVARARRLAGGLRPGTTAVLYTCVRTSCARGAQILKSNLAAIGLGLEVKSFPSQTLFRKIVTPGEPYDIANDGWVPDYPDPHATLNLLLEGNSGALSFDDPRWRARLAAAARLTGARRYLAYRRLDAELTRKASPLLAWGNYPAREFFSARMGCEMYGVYGLDLAALCLRR